MDYQSLIIGKDGLKRCWWCGADPLYMNYHDNEWGRPIYDDTLLFEKLSLEIFQSGLSWITVLRKRDNFRNAFNNFDFMKIATEYDNIKIEKLLQHKEIIRHKGKIEAIVNNSHKAIDLCKEYKSLHSYFWSFKPSSHTQPVSKKHTIAQTEISTFIANDLKRRGWKFVGATNIYAFMQAVGIVNDHIQGCGYDHHQIL